MAGVLMRFDTVGVNYYKGYLFAASVTEDITVLSESEASDYYKVIFIRSGTCHFMLGEKELVLTGSYAICLNECDKFEFIGEQRAELTILLFRPEVINTELNIREVNHPSPTLTLSSKQDLYLLNQFRHDADITLKILPLRAMDLEVTSQKLKLMNDLLTRQDSSYWPCRSRSYLFEILFCLVRQEEKDEPVRSIQFFQGPSRMAMEVIYYLQTCYNQKITIERLAEEFHTNRTTLLNDFKKHTGQSINQYLIKLRLNMASIMLRDTELSIEEICERTGFSDISYFSKVFKKELNLTPSGYRRLNQKIS
jgi:AraC family L-rhamnose operon regulatory protein RhaS